MGAILGPVAKSLGARKTTKTAPKRRILIVEYGSLYVVWYIQVLQDGMV